MSTQSLPAEAPSSPLKRREFRLYFVGNMVSNVGNWLSAVVLAVYMHDLTDSNFWVGLANFGLFAPVLFLALPAGVLADRFDRLTLLRRAQLAMAALAILLTVLAGAGLANRYAVTAIAFGLGAGVALAIPTMQALIPNMVPPRELGEAIQLNALTFNGARVLGPLAAAGVLGTIGAVWGFGINAATYFVLVLALVLIGRAPFPRAADRPPGPIREGIAYAWRHLHTRWMLLSIVAIGITLDPITTLAPALADERGLGDGGAGWIVAAWGSGAVAMLLFGRRVIRVVTEHGLGWMGLLVLSGGVATLGLAFNVPLLFLGAVLAGVGYITATMAFTTTIQAHVPESLRGRVSALWTLAFLGPRALASVADGALADGIGARPTAVAFCSVALVAAVFLRRVAGQRIEPVPPPA